MCLMGYVHIDTCVHVAWIVLDTCTLTFHLHVHVAWIVLDSCGDTCTSGYFWIYMYFWRHVHNWHFSYKWMIHFTLNLFFGFHMFLCQSIVLICEDYLLLMNALCQYKKTIIFKGFNDLTTCTLNSKILLV